MIKAIGWMILGILLNTVIIESLEVYDTAKFFDCIHTVKSYNKCREQVQTLAWPLDRPYLYLCWTPDGREPKFLCNLFGIGL